MSTQESSRVENIDMAGLNSTVGFLLKRAQLAVSRDITTIFSEFDITAVQFSVLTLAASNPGITQGHLALALEVERPRMVPVIDKLESRGLAVRRPDPDDGRSRRIHLTDEGASLLRQLQRRFSAQEARLASALGEDGLARFLAALRLLIDLRR
jgi:DNA-binding MarR family transcriptional regulator